MFRGEACSTANMSASVISAPHTPSEVPDEMNGNKPLADSAFSECRRTPVVAMGNEISSHLDRYNGHEEKRETEGERMDNSSIDPSISPSLCVDDSDYQDRYISARQLLNNNKGVSTETSKLLRGILQSKEKRLSNGNGGLIMDTNEDSQYMMSKIHQDSPVITRNGSFDTDLDSMRSATPGEFSSEESDHEVSVHDGSGDSERKGEEGSPEENPDNKKIRVENIINSIHQSPFKSGPDGTPIAAEARRHKRKQFIPQQHDTSLTDEPSTKVRKVEKDVLKKQLKLMQCQLSEMQQKYLELFDAPENCDSSDPELNEASMQRKLNGSSRMPEKQFKSHTIASLTEDLDPSHIIKQASRLVMDQEKAAKISVSGRPDSPDFDNLARMLKKEISHSVGSLVDNIVAKFIQKQKVKYMEKRNGDEKENNNVENTLEVKENREKTASPINIVPRENVMQERDQTPKEFPLIPKPTRTKVTDKLLPPVPDMRPRNFADLARHHGLFPPPPYFPHMPPAMQPLFPKEPEQTEALALVVNTPKKKRTKVTDTRLSPRAAKALLQDGSLSMGPGAPDLDRIPRDLPSLMRDMAHPPPPHHPHFPPHPGLHPDFHSPLVPVTLPTSVAIPNPSLQHSEVLAMYSQADQHHSAFTQDGRPLSHSPLIGDHGSPNMAHTPSDMPMSFMKSESEFQMFADHHNMQMETFDGMQMTSTLTPMHLRKAKLMFFYSRYPSSAILKIYFPDVKFNKNNTAQLVKWFSNFREFYYIQMEKYARQAIAEGVKNEQDLVVTTDSELYRVLNLHYNRNNQIEVPENFRMVVQNTLREFFRSVFGNKDTEQSWKKSIYKVIARQDDQLPEFFKSPNWMEQLNDL